MSKSKLWRFKKFLIIAMFVLIAVAATPASATYFSDSFKQNSPTTVSKEVKILFAIPDLISSSLQKLTGVNGIQLAAFGKASILGKF